MNKLRIGFLSTAGIGRKNWKAVYYSGNCVVAAVASREVEKSRKFIADCSKEAAFEVTPTALGSYEALLESKEIDAVYLPLPTALRKDWVIRAAKAGKHILCEKPCAIRSPDLEEMLTACRKNRVQFLDGVMFMHSARLQKVRETLDDGQSVGDIKRIASQFSFYGRDQFFQENIRINAGLEPAGCLGDLGWYNIRFALWVMNWRLPREVCGRLLAKTEGSVPTDFSAELIFDGGVSASFYCSFVNFRQQWVHVSGSRGYLEISDFVNPFYGSELAFQVTNIGQDGFKVVPEVRRITVAEHANGHATAQEANMFRNFARQISSGKLNEEWPMWSSRTQKVLDACLQSAGRNCSIHLG
ncbi:MAG TPA: Gfo/Idh/MocA family oxidoreductase [Verrucomicrobiae bacterium]|nr:Gfo/Idh/MocA family oxidoreductase [Verrucomicrobiae bacterium]